MGQIQRGARWVDGQAQLDSAFIAPFVDPLTPWRTGYNAVSAAAGDYSASLTVPAGTNLVVAFWSHWDANGGTSASSLTIGGASMTILAQRVEGVATDVNGVGIAILVNPPTGSQTHTLTWSGGGARQEGGELVFIYYADGNTADPYSAVGVNSASSGNSANTTLANVAATDRVVGFLGRYYSQGTSVLAPVTAFINDTTVNANVYDVGDGDGFIGTVVIDNAGTDHYSFTAGIALKASSGASAYPTLSAAELINLTQTQATPRVTITVP